MNVRALLISCVLLSPGAFAAGSATPAEQLTVPPGFKVELLKSATEREGSWVSMAIDDKGRLYISPQNKTPEGGIMRVKLDDSGRIAKIDWLKPDVGAAMGMLWAFNSLYVSGQGPDGQAIYRLRDTDGDGELDRAELFKKVPGGGGEHGAHAIVLGPDNKLYFVHGNSTPLIDGIDPNSPYRNYGEDILIPRVMDPVATFFDKLRVPYGHVLRTDENGTKWELITGGMRNAYDIDFNTEGELFTYDSDMEWDVGLPWYRPSRVLHIVPGAEFGFREGNQKWPDYYPDSLPPVCDIGLGCPTGVKFGTHSNFPEKYRRAFFIMDWTFGRILAVSMRPKGASYTASNPLKGYFHPTGPEADEDVEVFLSGKGMPLSDLEFGKEGAMYFTIGGRGTQGGLYRVSYVGPTQSEIETPALGKLFRENVAKSNQERRDLRRLLETPPRDAKNVWVAARNHLGSNDLFVRFAARCALESVEPTTWKAISLDPKQLDPGVRTGLEDLLALARVGTKEDQAALLKALTKFPLDSLDDELKLLKLRIIKVSFARQGRPAEELVKMGVEKLNRQYPAKTFALNRELSELLIWLTKSGADLQSAAGMPAEPASRIENPRHIQAATEVIDKTLTLLESSPAQEEQIWYACMLREAAGWTPAQRERYFPWFVKARSVKGGNSAQKFIARIKDDALAHVPEAERKFFAALAEGTVVAAEVAPPRPFVKAWSLADLAPDLDKIGIGRNFNRGREMYAAAQCAICHLFGGKGNLGPDLTAVSSRYNRRDLLEAIIDPNKGLSEQYPMYRVTQFDGKKDVAGMIVEENNEGLKVLVDPLRGTTESISKFQPPKRELLQVSPMPPGLLSTLSKDEVLDLLAYLESGGNPEAAAFKPAAR